MEEHFRRAAVDVCVGRGAVAQGRLRSRPEKMLDACDAAHPVRDPPPRWSSTSAIGAPSRRRAYVGRRQSLRTLDGRPSARDLRPRGRAHGWFIFTGVPYGFKPMLRTPAYETAAVRQPSASPDGSAAAGLQAGRRRRRTATVFRQNGWGGSTSSPWSGARPPGTVEGAWSITSRFSDERGEPTAPDLAIAEAQAARGSSRFASEVVGCLLVPFGRAAPRSAAREAMVPGAGQAGVPAHRRARRSPPAGRLDGRRRASSRRGRATSTSDLDAQLYLARLRGRPSRAGPGVSRLAVADEGRIQALHQGLFRNGRLERTGVSTLLGQPMGGWTQYAFSPTVSA